MSSNERFTILNSIRVYRTNEKPDRFSQFLIKPVRSDLSKQPVFIQIKFKILGNKEIPKIEEVKR